MTLAKMTKEARAIRLACEIRWDEGCSNLGWFFHHKLLKSRGGKDDRENLAWTCEHCHGSVHTWPAEATSRGWMISQFKGDE